MHSAEDLDLEIGDLKRQGMYTGCSFDLPPPEYDLNYSIIAFHLRWFTSTPPPPADSFRIRSLSLSGLWPRPSRSLMISKAGRSISIRRKV